MEALYHLFTQLADSLITRALKFCLKYIVAQWLVDFELDAYLLANGTIVMKNLQLNYLTINSVLRTHYSVELSNCCIREVWFHSREDAVVEFKHHTAIDIILKNKCDFEIPETFLAAQNEFLTLRNISELISASVCNTFSSRLVLTSDSVKIRLLDCNSSAEVAVVLLSKSRFVTRLSSIIGGQSAQAEASPAGSSSLFVQKLNVQDSDGKIIISIPFAVLDKTSISMPVLELFIRPTLMEFVAYLTAASSAHDADVCEDTPSNFAAFNKYSHASNCLSSWSSSCSSFFFDSIGLNRIEHTEQCECESITGIEIKCSHICSINFLLFYEDKPHGLFNVDCKATTLFVSPGNILKLQMKSVELSITRGKQRVLLLSSPSEQASTPDPDVSSEYQLNFDLRWNCSDGNAKDVFEPTCFVQVELNRLDIWAKETVKSLKSVPMLSTPGKMSDGMQNYLMRMEVNVSHLRIMHTASTGEICGPNFSCPQVLDLTIAKLNCIGSCGATVQLNMNAGPVQLSLHSEKYGLGANQPVGSCQHICLHGAWDDKMTEVIIASEEFHLYGTVDAIVFIIAALQSWEYAREAPPKRSHTNKPNSTFNENDDMKESRGYSDHRGGTIGDHADNELTHVLRASKNYSSGSKQRRVESSTAETRWLHQAADHCNSMFNSFMTCTSSDDEMCDEDKKGLKKAADRKVEVRLVIENNRVMVKLQVLATSNTRLPLSSPSPSSSSLSSLSLSSSSFLLQNADEMMALDDLDEEHFERIIESSPQPDQNVAFIKSNAGFHLELTSPLKISLSEESDSVTRIELTNKMFLIYESDTFDGQVTLQAKLGHFLVLLFPLSGPAHRIVGPWRARGTLEDQNSSLNFTLRSYFCRNRKSYFSTIDLRGAPQRLFLSGDFWNFLSSIPSHLPFPSSAEMKLDNVHVHAFHLKIDHAPSIPRFGVYNFSRMLQLLRLLPVDGMVFDLPEVHMNREEIIQIGDGLSNTATAVLQNWCNAVSSSFVASLHSPKGGRRYQRGRYNGTMQRVIFNNLKNGCTSMLHYSHKVLLGVADSLYVAAGTAGSQEGQPRTGNSSLSSQPRNIAAGIQHGIEVIDSGIHDTVDIGLSPLLKTLVREDAPSTPTLTAARCSLLQPLASGIHAMGLTLQGMRNGLDGSRRVDEEDKFKTTVSARFT